MTEKQGEKGVRESPKNDPDALRQKLNEAISSHFSGGSPKGSAQHSVQNGSLIDIVKDELDKSNSSTFNEEQIDEDTDAESEASVVEVPVVEKVETKVETFNGEPEDLNVHDSEAEVNFDTNLFSDAFEKIEYQSVDIEIDEEKGSPVDEDDSRYAQIVQKALKSSTKSRVETVLDPEIMDEETEVMRNVTENKENKTEVLEKETVSDVNVEIKNPFSSEKDISFGTVSKKDSISDSVSPDRDILLKESIVKKYGSKDTKAEILEELKRKQAISSKARNPIGKNQNIFRKTEVINEREKQTPADISLKKSTTDDSDPEIVFLYSEKHLEHDPSSLSIKAHENPERLIKAMWYLEKSGIFKREQCTLTSDFEMATEEDLLRAHDDSYVEFVRSYSSAGGGFLGDSTYMTPGSYDVAKTSAGAAIKAGSLVAEGKYPYAFVMTRPPGHHASRSKYGGFCLFNNVAILARYLQKKKGVGKVMVIDWDAHAGDGTMDIFYEDPTVMLVSLHRDPHGFYPRKGFSKETGEGAGKGYTVNVEMPVGAGDEDYELAFGEVVMPLIKSFAPEFVICSCGFDAYYKEKNIGLSLTSEGFYKMTSMLRSLYKKNFVLMMEGGYHDFNGQLCHSVLSALLGEENPVKDKPEISSFKRNQQKQILAETKKKLEELKEIISLPA